MNTTTINRTRAAEANRLTCAAAIVCALGFVSALSVLVEHAVSMGLLVLVLAVGLAVVVRRVARVLRWRREDRADAITAVAWRAAHARQEVA